MSARLLLVDNKDSFTYNLSHLFGMLGAAVDVVRNDDPALDEAAVERADAIVIGPGPGRPADAGKRWPRSAGPSPRGAPSSASASANRPSASPSAAQIVPHPRLMHGKTSNDQRTTERRLPRPAVALLGDALPLAVPRARSLPAALTDANAFSEDGVIQGIAHRDAAGRTASSSIPSPSSRPKAARSSQTSWRWWRHERVLATPASACSPARTSPRATWRPRSARSWTARGRRRRPAPSSPRWRRRARRPTRSSARPRRCAAAACTSSTASTPSSTSAAPAATARAPSTSRPASASSSAACGVPVAKHGNRAASSECGSADVLEASGIDIDATPDEAAARLERDNFAFLFAQRYHPAMKAVAPVRRELRVRTVFNLLGPLTNPARATHQVIGVAHGIAPRTHRRGAARLGGARRGGGARGQRHRRDRAGRADARLPVRPGGSQTVRHRPGRLRARRAARDHQGRHAGAQRRRHARHPAGRTVRARRDRRARRRARAGRRRARRVAARGARRGARRHRQRRRARRLREHAPPVEARCA